jgi:glucose-6-phosphate isomerase
VGLLPLALAGVDVAGLLAGAAEMDERCRTEELLLNPAAVHAAVQWLMHVKKQKPISVTFAYSQRLAALGDWYAQLLGESIGKRSSRSGEVVHAGPTPVRALGVTDQHSQVQLYVEGPFDKWFQILAVDAPERTVRVPAGPEQDLEGVSYLYGRTLNDLFAAERDGTRIALTEARRPNATFHFPSITPSTVGQFLQLLEVSVALMGEHYDVDAFDQPGVEAGKLAAYALMGRKGHERRRVEIEARASAKARMV